MPQQVEYITKEGERWDTIANKAYGDAVGYDAVNMQNYIDKIIQANPSVVISPVLAPGVRLLIPVLEDAEIEIDSELLPPWKR